MHALLKPLKAKFSYPDEFREPRPEMEFSGMEVEVIGTFNDPKTANEIRVEYGECLMVCRTPAGDEFVVFETELDMPEGYAFAMAVGARLQTGRMVE